MSSARGLLLAALSLIAPPVMAVEMFGPGGVVFEAGNASLAMAIGDVVPAYGVPAGLRGRRA